MAYSKNEDALEFLEDNPNEPFVLLIKTGDDFKQIVSLVPDELAEKDVEDWNLEDRMDVLNATGNFTKAMLDIATGIADTSVELAAYTITGLVKEVKEK